MRTDWVPVITESVRGSNGEEWFISDGSSQGKTWATYRHRGGRPRRVTSPSLPTRPTRFEAERDLAVYLCQRRGEPRWVLEIIERLSQ
jgi:hypothetical protein